jgi:hypothetical protein
MLGVESSLFPRSDAFEVKVPVVTPGVALLIVSNTTACAGTDVNASAPKLTEAPNLLNV